MKKFYIFILIGFIAIKTNGQAPGIQWQKSLGGTSSENASCIQQTTDGGYIFAGMSGSNNGDVTGNHGGGDYWIVKIDALGSIQWQKSLGGSSIYAEGAKSIQQTSDGGYIVAGSSKSNNGDVSGNHGGYDYWIVKINSVGTIIWQKSFGGSADDEAYSIQQTSDNGYIVAGYTRSSNGDVSGNHGDFDYWIVKINSVGTIIWQKCLGGSEMDYANSVSQTSDGGYIIAGSTKSNNGDVLGLHGPTGLIGNPDYWVVKLNSSGAIQWQKCLGGIDYDVAQSIQQTTDGGYIVGGFSGSNGGDVSGNHGINSSAYDYWIVKLNNIGTIQWQKCYGGGYTEMLNSIQQTPDNGYIMAGYTSSTDGNVTGNHNIANSGLIDCWIVKVNSLGLLEWQKCLGGSDTEMANSIRPTSDGGYIMAGYSASNNGQVSGNHGSNDCWIVKLSQLTDIKENTEHETLSIYPNPASSVFTITTIDEKISEIIVMNMHGKVIHRQKATGNSETIDMSMEVNGIYFVKVRTEKRTLDKKIVKE